MQEYRLSTKFNWQKTYSDLAKTFSSWDVSSWHVTEPRKKALNDYWASEEDRIVHIRFELRGKTINLSMSKQPRAVDNFRVLYLAIEDMRMQERRGISEVLESAYLQLAAPVGERDPYEVLGIWNTATVEEAEAIYKIRVKKAHPDAGGSNEQMKELNDAIEKIRKKSLANS